MKRNISCQAVPQTTLFSSLQQLLEMSAFCPYTRSKTLMTIWSMPLEASNKASLVRQCCTAATDALAAGPHPVTPYIVRVRRVSHHSRWQVTLCDPIWHVISRSGEVISTNCCTRLLTLDLVCWYQAICISSYWLFSILKTLHKQFVWKHQASTPGSSAAPEGHDVCAERVQSRDVLARDEAVKRGPADVNYRVSSITVFLVVLIGLLRWHLYTVGRFLHQNAHASVKLFPAIVDILIRVSNTPGNLL